MASGYDELVELKKTADPYFFYTALLESLEQNTITVEENVKLNGDALATLAVIIASTAREVRELTQQGAELIVESADRILKEVPVSTFDDPSFVQLFSVGMTETFFNCGFNKADLANIIFDRIESKSGVSVTKLKDAIQDGGEKQDRK